MIDNFINIPFSIKNLDRFYIRTSIFKAIKKSIPFFQGNLLDIGCGKMPYKEYILQNWDVEKYIGLDIETALNYDTNSKPDVTWNGITMPFENESFNCAFGTEVLEHCPEPETVLNEVHRVLKKDGVFFFTIPFLWPLHEVPHDEYRYTPFSIENHLKNVGFKDVTLKATGGWHASMAQMLGLWVRRSPMSKRKRKYLSILFKPIINFLIKMDKTANVKFIDGQMITGLYGTARKI